MSQACCKTCQELDNKLSRSSSNYSGADVWLLGNRIPVLQNPRSLTAHPMGQRCGGMWNRAPVLWRLIPWGSDAGDTWPGE